MYPIAVDVKMRTSQVLIPQPMLFSFVQAWICVS
jgi:hypothetical protein